MTQITTKSGRGVPTASDLVEAELAVDLDSGSLYTKLGDGKVTAINSAAFIGIDPNADNYQYWRYKVNGKNTVNVFSMQDLDFKAGPGIDIQPSGYGIEISATGGGAAGTHIGELPPDDPQQGQLWLDISGEAVMWIYDESNGGQWLEHPSSGGGGLEDAPDDGEMYARQSNAWAQIPETDLSDYYTSTEVDAKLNDYVLDTPDDGNLYVRRNGAWEIYTPSSGGGFGGNMQVAVQPATAGDFRILNTEGGAYEASVSGTKTLQVPAGMVFMLSNIFTYTGNWDVPELVIDGLRPWANSSINLGNGKYLFPPDGSSQPPLVVENSLSITKTSGSSILRVYGIFYLKDSTLRDRIKDKTPTTLDMVEDEPTVSTQELSDD